MADADSFRKLALALPDVSEHPHFDRRAFKARVTFATLAADNLTANIKFSPDEQALKSTVAPDAFRPLPNAWGARGWTLVKLDALSEAELDAALRMAWAPAQAKPVRRTSRGNAVKRPSGSPSRR